ncbi:MAG TPA: phage holin family protein [Vicinamibacterales bacterium]|nr:phage holin family protein [Vicinamibacterales bacterium]
MAYDDPRHESLTGTLGKIVDDVRELFREEIALARAELRGEMSDFSSAAIWLAVGAAAALFALSFLLLAVAQGFTMLVGWPSWSGYFAMAVLLAIAATYAISSGRSRVRAISAVPPQTAATIKETKEWIQQRISSEPR